MGVTAISDAWDISAGGVRDLQRKLSDYYGVDGIWIHGDFYHEECHEILYDVLAFWDGDEEHFIADEVPVYGHGPSGAAGVFEGDLPSKEEVQSVVAAAEERDADD
jgi:hypothetical protein